MVSTISLTVGVWSVTVSWADLTMWRWVQGGHVTCHCLVADTSHMPWPLSEHYWGRAGTRIHGGSAVQRGPALPASSGQTSAVARPGLSSGKQGVPPPPALHTVTTNTFSLQERNTNTQGTSHTITYLTIKSTKHLDNQEKYFPYKLCRGSENIFFLKKSQKCPPCLRVCDAWAAGIWSVHWQVMSHVECPGDAASSVWTQDAVISVSCITQDAHHTDPPITSHLVCVTSHCHTTGTTHLLLTIALGNCHDSDLQFAKHSQLPIKLGTQSWYQYSDLETS